VGLVPGLGIPSLPIPLIWVGLVGSATLVEFDRAGGTLRIGRTFFARYADVEHDIRSIEVQSDRAGGYRLAMMTSRQTSFCRRAGKPIMWANTVRAMRSMIS
jgi:hypothetical protein